MRHLMFRICLQSQEDITRYFFLGIFFLIQFSAPRIFPWKPCNQSGLNCYIQWWKDFWKLISHDKEAWFFFFFFKISIPLLFLRPEPASYSPWVVLHFVANEMLFKEKMSHWHNLPNFSFSSVHSLVSNSLWPRGLQHVRPPCSSPTPKAYSVSCPSSQWCHSTISSSVVPFSPAFSLSQHQGLFKWVSSSHQVVKVLELQLQHQSFQWIFRTDFL